MAPRVVDLRSDTVTQPTDDMREAMLRAAVGDDVYGEDPTVNALQELAAKKLGKEAALFVPTGTMGNEVAILVHTRREGEVIAESKSHIILYEQGGPSFLSGAMVRAIEGVRGVFTAAQTKAAMRDPEDPHEPPTRLVLIENSHNLAGGTVWTPAQTDAVAKAARERGVPLHIDGARIFNSAVAQGVKPDRLVKEADSVMFCLSKGLSAPVGSLLVGSKPFIDRAWRARKVLGGGMRQAGVLAAPGLIALTKMVDRLEEDHANARRLAVGLSKLPGLSVDLEGVQTNIVLVDTTKSPVTAAQIAATAGRHNVKCLALGPNLLRFVTHRHIERADVATAIEAVEVALGQTKAEARTTKRRARNEKFQT